MTHAALAHWLRLALAVALIALVAAAQDVVQFDPSRDLEGFDKASVSEYKELYPLQQYLDKRGADLAPEELAKLRAQWKVEREAVTRRIEAILTDPREAHFFALEKQLARHAYFSKARFDVDRSVPGMLFLVQKPSGPRPETQDPRKLAEFYGPPMRRLSQAFEKTFVTPLGLTRRADYPVFTLCILDNEDEFHAFAQVTEQAWLLGVAYYDPKLAMILAYGDPYAPETSPARQRRFVLAEEARALQHAYYGGREERPTSLWLNLGFAAWYAWREGVLADEKDKTAIEPDLLELVLKAAQSKADRELVLHPLLDLVQVRVTSDILLLAKNRAEEEHAKPPEVERALQLFYAQAALWIHFLHDGQGGRFREPFTRFFSSAMSGLGGLDAFYMSFRGIEVDTLDKDFYAYLAAEHQRAFPKVALDRTWIDAPFADRKSKRKEAAKGGAPLPDPGSEAPELYGTASVAVGPGDYDGLHGLALLQAMKGDLEGALQSLEAIDRARPEPPEDVRAAREIERLRQFLLLRDGYLQNLIQTAQPLTVKHRNLEVVAVVKSVEDGWIHLAENRQGISKLPLTSLDPFEIAKQAGRREEQGSAEPWARFWPYVLVGEKKWEQLLKPDSDKARELREDAKSVYPEIQRAARAATALNELAAIPEPKSMPDAEKLFAAVKSILAAYGDLPIVQRKTDALRQLVGGVIVHTYAEQDPSKLCKGTWTTLGNGLVNIVYDFTKPDEAEDFVRVEGYLPELHKSQPATVKSEADSNWTVANGEFAGSGSACYRHFAELTAPIRVAYDVMFRVEKGGEKAKEGQPPAFMFLVGACDDGKGSYTACLNFGSLAVVDVANQIYTTLADDKPTFAKKVFHQELKNDGNEVTTWVNGEKRFDAPSAGLRSGSVILWFHSDHTIVIQKLEIEGRLDPAWPEKARSQFYRRKLAEMGFR